MDLASLKTAWAAVRTDFFPRWDRANAWRIRFANRREIVGHGKCLPDRKLILIGHCPSDPDERDTLLIHETCHAYVPGHGVTWLRCMNVRQDRARELGRDRLASFIDTEMGHYAGQPKLRPLDIYRQLEDLIHGAGSPPTLRQAAKWLGAEIGMTAGELLRFAVRLPKVYAQATKDAADARRRRAALN
jgi:hypothetical protein